MAEEGNSGRAVHMSCRLLMLLGVAALVVTLAGFVITGIEGFFMGGLQSNLNTLSATNDDLKLQADQFSASNEVLKQQLANLSSIQGSLQQQVEYYSLTNKQMQATIQALNETDNYLHDQIVSIEDITTALTLEVFKLVNKTDELQGDIQYLQNTSDSLQEQLNNLQQLSADLHYYDSADLDDFSKMMTTVVSLFQNTTVQTFQNQRTLLLQFANYIELIDGLPDFSTYEYDLFLYQISNATFYTYSYLKERYPYNDTRGGDTVVTYPDMERLIGEVVTAEEVEWLGFKPENVVLKTQRQYDDALLEGYTNSQQSTLYAEFKRLLF